MKRLITIIGIIILGLFAITLFSTCDIDSAFVDLIQGKIDADSGIIDADSGITDIISSNIDLLKVVPAGSFQRDSTSTNISVITTAFRMSEHEITRDQFLAIMGDDLSDPDYSSIPGTSDPVQKANWYHAIAFCNKLSITEGLTQVYSVTVSGTPVDFSTLVFDSIPVGIGSIADDWDEATANWSANGYRLPTEMEWMWAAMGATSGSGYTEPMYLTGYGKFFSGSNSTLADGSGGTNVIGDYAWYSDNSDSKTHPAGTKLANELGLYDMSGNVWEWNWDWYDVYPTGTIYSNTAAGRGAASGTTRVRRGGSWNFIAPYCTMAIRLSTYPYYEFSDIGFRVVLP